MSSFEKETVWCFFTSCENVETLAVDLGLNQSKFSSKPFSILTIFPEVPAPVASAAVVNCVCLMKC